jgi:hemerythrin
MLYRFNAFSKNRASDTIPLMRLNDSYSVGVKEIDIQYRNLVSYLRPILRHDPEQKQHHPIVAGAAYELYTGAFGSRHQAFAKRIADFRAKMEGGQAALSINPNFFKEWVFNHIWEPNKKFGPFFNKHDLT